MRGFVEVTWIVFSLLGLLYAIKGAGSSHADFAAASRMRDRFNVEFLFASSVYRSQIIRVSQLIALLVVGTISALVPDHYEWRSAVLLFGLLYVTVSVSVDTYLHDKSRKKIKSAFFNGGGRPSGEQRRQG